MKRYLLLSLLATMPLGCVAPDEEINAEAASTPTATVEEIQIRQDEARWKALYNRVSKNFASKMIPRKLDTASIEAAQAAAQKDQQDVENILVPRRYGGANRKLRDGFRSLRSAYTYAELGSRIDDRQTLELARKDFLTAARSFNEAAVLVAKAQPKPTATPRPTRTPYAGKVG